MDEGTGIVGGAVTVSSVQRAPDAGAVSPERASTLPPPNETLQAGAVTVSSVQRAPNAGAAPPERASTQPPPVETLSKRIEGIDQRLTAIERQRVEILEFSFQSILVVLTILGLAAGIPFALLYGTKIAVGDVAYVITGLLIALVVLMMIWLVLWWTRNVSQPTPKERDRSG